MFYEKLSGFDLHIKNQQTMGNIDNCATNYIFPFLWVRGSNAYCGFSREGDVRRPKKQTYAIFGWPKSLMFGGHTEG